MYCPICGKVLTADNLEDVIKKKSDKYFYVHDPIPHTRNDVYALSLMLQ